MTRLNPPFLAKNKKERKPRKSSLLPPFCKSYMKEMPRDADLHAVKSWPVTVRRALSGTLPTQGPSVSHRPPCSLQAWRLNPTSPPGTRAQREKSLLPWPRPQGYKSKSSPVTSTPPPPLPQQIFGEAANSFQFSSWAGGQGVLNKSRPRSEMFTGAFV